MYAYLFIYLICRPLLPSTNAMMSSSSSSTPPALTPDVTGSGLETGKAEKKPTRRQIAFYPNMNSSNKPVKPFSRSAAKRQSVMTLGSIEHLQHYFTKAGLSAKTKCVPRDFSVFGVLFTMQKSPSNKPQSQFVPAIGGLLALQTDMTLESVQEFELPPSPVIPESRPLTFPLFAKTYETDPDAFLPGVVEDLVAVTYVWGIQGSTEKPDPSYARLSSTSPTSSPSPSPSVSKCVDVLNVLQTTTRAIRSVRNYVIALPDESAGTLRSQYRNRIATGDPVKRHKSKSPHPDPLSMIRKSALEVLSALRDLEERSRVPLTDEAYDAQSDRGSSQGHNPPSRVASPSGVSDDDTDSQPFDPDMSISFIRVQGRYDSVPVWEDENDQDVFNMSEEEQDNKRERWDDKLVLGGGWLYRQDTRLEDLAKERDIVDRYTRLVDDVLFDERKDGVRGWERARERIAKRDREGRNKNRRVSAGDVESLRFPSGSSSRPTRRVVSSGMLKSMQEMTLTEEPGEMEVLSEEESVGEEDLPEWAKRASFADDPIGLSSGWLLPTLG